MRAALLLAFLMTMGCLGPGTAPAPDGGGQPVSLSWTWRSHAAAPTPHTEVNAAALGTDIYVVGGFDSAGNNVATVDIYDTARDAWRRGPDYPLPIHHTTLRAIGASLYAFGGFTTAQFVATNLAFRLDTASGLWLPVAALPLPRAAHGAAVVDGKVYLVGGFTSGFVLTPEVDVYDAGANTWTRAPDLPTPRDHLLVLPLEGKVWAVGGETGGHDKNVATVEELEPSKGWTAAPELPRPRGSLSGGALDGHIVAVGGQDPQRTFDDADIFDPASARWSALPPMPTARHGFGAVVVGERLFVLEGGPQPGQSVTGAVESLGP
jgi:hypothetical protein